MELLKEVKDVEEKANTREDEDWSDVDDLATVRYPSFSTTVATRKVFYFVPFELKNIFIRRLI